MMKNLILGLAILVGNTVNFPAYTSNNISRKVVTYRVTLTTANGRYVIDTVTAQDYNDAMRVIYSRYPNCTIYSMTPIGRE